MRILFALLLSFSASVASLGQSVLSSGEWHKVSVKESGVYKIDRSFIRKTLGVDMSSFDPRTLKLFGSPSNGMLPQENSIPRANEPVEFAIQGVGTNDGSMDDGDYFLFSAYSSDQFQVDTSMHYQKNIYSDISTYLITYGGSDGRRISTIQSEIGGSISDTYTEYLIHELDEVNRFKSGKLWVGDNINNLAGSQKTFRYDVAGATGEVSVQIGAIGSCLDGCDFSLSLNEVPLGQLPIEAISRATYDDKAKYSEAIFKGTISGDNLELLVDFNQTGNGTAHVDYFVISYQRNLAIYGDQTILHTGLLEEAVTYEVANSTSSTQIWDITDRVTPKEINKSLEESISLLHVTAGQGKTFIAFNPTNRPSPTYVGPVANQDIKSLINQEGIIVTAPAFINEAIRLANFHQQQDQLKVGVVTTDQIYNEFSGGSQDITAIRDYLRQLYLQAGALKYVLLFGDGSYDYKDRVNNNTNFVPVYQSRNSFHPIYSHSSDDYYGFFDEDEGGWSEGIRRKNSSSYEVPYDDDTLEIGIGRLPVKTVQEASTVVDKIIRYKTSSKALGKWRNEMAYFSDDGDNATHMEHAERLFTIVDTSYLTYNAKKLYLDNFDQENNKSPQATQAILNALKEGVFVFNYIGHGNEEQLTIENVINSTVIDQLTNRQKLPLFVTATCDFGKYDDPAFTSGAELLLLSENGGAIALLSTTRPVFAHTNFPVNQAFHENLFKKINGKAPRLGDIIKATKNSSLRGPVNRNFALLGDPMLQLNYPEYEITFDQMSAQADTISALEDYLLSGSIMANGSIKSTFNGTAIVTLWDIPKDKITKGSGNAPYQYQDQTNALYRGEVTVREGRFSLGFILPKNTSYQYRPGKLTMYAWNENELIDASGATRNFVLGGTTTNPSSDNKPPNGIAYLNESSFVSGGTVGTNSLFIAELSDESGINISSNGFNNSITLTLNDAEPITLNEFYTAKTNDYTAGTIMFPLQNLEPGSYSGELKFWDTHNNSATIQVEFKVSDKPVIRIYNDNIFPNPVSSHQETTFRFEHDREGEELEIEISVYGLNGEQVYRKLNTIDNSPGTIDDIKWTVSSFDGSQLQKGIYIYRMSVTSTLDGANNQVIKRLIIIN